MRIEARAGLVACTVFAAAIVVTGAARSDDLESASQDLHSEPGNALRVCADPNNLPYSDDAERGFENRLAEIVADELDAVLSYVWWPQRRGFVRNTLNAGDCDLIIGVPAEYEMVDTTRPYYTSSYVLVSGMEVDPPLTGLTDPRLRTLKIGVHLTGNDGTNPPPVHALGELGIVDNVVGYMIYGNYEDPSPPSKLIEAVAAGEIDVAAVWGPIGGYFAARSTTPLTVVPISYRGASAFASQFEFAMAMGVRKGDAALREQVQAALDRRSADVQQTLADYAIPLTDRDSTASSATSAGNYNSQVTR